MYPHSLTKELSSARRRNRILTRRLGGAAGGAASSEEEQEEEVSTEPPQAPSAPCTAKAASPAAKSPAKGAIPQRPDAPSTAALSTPETSAAGHATPAQSSPGLEKQDYLSLLAKKGQSSLLRRLVFPSSIEEYLAEYLKYQAGSATTGRVYESALSKLSQVRAFIYYMVQNKKELWKWLFLSDTETIRR